MATIAFAHNEKVWTTQYSFEADNYNFVDNQFLSLFNNVDPELDPQTEEEVRRVCWMHEKTFTDNGGAPYNCFFGVSTPSFFVTSLNENPSVEKTLRALSIESNQPDFDAVIRCNAEIEDGQGIPFQTTYIDNFDLREGALYANISQSSSNSKANMHFVGVATSEVSEEIGDANGQLYRFKIQESGESWLVPHLNITSTNIDDIFNQVSAFINFQNGSLYQAIGVPFNANFQFYQVFGQNLPTTLNNVFDGVTSYSFCIGSDGYMYVRTNFGTAMQENIEIGKPIFMYMHPHMDGDEMRGKYALVSVIQKGPSNSFEIYGLNVEYSQSKLDTE